MASPIALNDAIYEALIIYGAFMLHVGNIMEWCDPPLGLLVMQCLFFLIETRESPVWFLPHISSNSRVLAFKQNTRHFHGVHHSSGVE